ncbi:cation transporter [Chachezhania antarctica]|uniref:cation transporter n=1 Tax=Chachezhania antarctica TaxID=2340860 RepID=UPI0013CE66F1|nr:cation transporter [Chachezhania antarctica]|tara:strand:- start:3136 stop:3996 length:861 start_codon:yes stop_codon:yes gene_type:complete
MIRPVAADVAIATALALAGLLSGSLTMISEAIRSLLMLPASVVGLWLLRANHRGKMARFEFGVDKVERFASMLIGVALLICGPLIAGGAIESAMGHGLAASPLGLALAAAVNAVNTAVNVMGWLSLRSLPVDRRGETFQSQYAARVTMMRSSLVLQVTLTAAALAQDPVLANGLDAFGAVYVAVLMIAGGVSMLRRTLPHIVDRRPDDGLSDHIARAVVAAFPEARLGPIRTRPVGEGVAAEIRLTLPPLTPAENLRTGRATILEQLGARAVRPVTSLTLVPEPSQ